MFSKPRKVWSAYSVLIYYVYTVLARIYGASIWAVGVFQKDFKKKYEPKMDKIVDYAMRRIIKNDIYHKKIEDRVRNPEKYSFIYITEDDISFITSELKKYGFIVFCAVLTSSIIKKLSIIGSDINVGKIITEKRVPDEIQLEIINYLRAKGFHIFHISENISNAENEGIMFFTLDDMKNIFNNVYNKIEYDEKSSDNYDMMMAFSDHHLMKFFSSVAIFGNMNIKYDLYKK